jgi:hypothetical protein
MKDNNTNVSTEAKTAKSLHRRLNDLMVLQGRAIANQNRMSIFDSLHDAEFKVFSQFGEDGIIQYLQQLVIKNESEKRFIEFGVENYLESNTRFLLVNNNWRGLVFDGSRENIESIKSQEFYWRNDLTAKNAWIDRDNINDLIKSEGFDGEIGILSVDIDGNDYWVWESIEVVNPIIVIVEWNSLFGDKAAISIPYSPSFQRTEAHFSNLYYGASIAALHHLGEKKGYKLIGSNSAGNNLFFVREDRMGPLKALSPNDAYVESKIRESRDEKGDLSFKSRSDREALIKHLPVVDVTTGKHATLSDFNGQ